MSKICTKIASKLFANKTKVHFMQPKSLNLYFKNAQNPELKFINLSNVSTINFKVDNKDDSTSSLIANIVYKNGTSAELLISTFANYEDAMSAFDEVRVKLYSPSNSVVKHFITLMVAMLFIMMVGDFSTNIREVIKSEEVKSQSISSDNTVAQKPTLVAQPTVAPVASASVPPPPTNEEIDALILQLQQIKTLQAQPNAGAEQELVGSQPQVEPQPQAEVSEELSPSDKLLKGLN